MSKETHMGPILVAGSGKLAHSVSVCFAQAGHRVTLLTDAVAEAQRACNTHFADVRQYTTADVNHDLLEILSSIPDARSFRLAVVVTGEDLVEKQTWIEHVESLVAEDVTIAINTESFDLSMLQEGARFPRRIIGANWTEPAHTTRFLELIENENTDAERVENVAKLARDFWEKDSYCLTHGSGIRQRLMSALIREAMYLVENEYASVEDIDRACRNDAGYYLPFAGNCRYMDLMGTYAYGMVMKDLNPELAKNDTVASFYSDILEMGGKGMENNAGFFDYQPGEVTDWEEKARRFSYQIQEIIEQYSSSQPIEAAALVSANGQSKE